MATRESGRAQGGELEEKTDLSAETDAKLLQCAQLLQANQLNEALQLLTALEKRCRVGNDNASLVRVCEAALKACYEADDTATLLSTLKTFATRRSQKTAAIKALVQTALPWCVQEPYTPLPVTGIDAATKRDQLVEALRELTDGKIFLERERAQLTRVAATLREEAGDIHGASQLLQQVHVETYGSLSKREKVEFILEQMRITLAAHDYVRAAIVAGKVSRKFLAEESMHDYKVRFFSLLTISHRHEKDALALAKDYHAIYSTPSTLQDETQWMAALQATVLFLALSPYNNEQQDMMHRIAQDANLEKLPAYQ
jgi:26S proteasome regulatory subunit N5